MIEKYLNKQVQITIAFGSWGGGGAVPEHFIGKIVDVDDVFIEVEFDPSNKLNKTHFYKNTVGKMIINRNYIIDIALM